MRTRVSNVILLSSHYAVNCANTKCTLTKLHTNNERNRYQSYSAVTVVTSHVQTRYANSPL